MGVFNHPATVTEMPRAAVLEGEPALVVRLKDVLDRLEALPPALRGLVQACAESRLDGDLLGFLADYLDEYGMAGGQRVRLLRPGEGDLLVFWPYPGQDVGTEDDRVNLARAISDQHGRHVVLMASPAQEIALADPDQLRAAGWVRIEERDRAIRRERGAAAEVVRNAPPWMSQSDLAASILSEDGGEG